MSLYRILIVDDDEGEVLIHAAALKRAGYDVDWATNGWEGIAKARAVPPDLVLLDVMMPEMDGWTFMKFVRAHRDLAALPVIFVTGRGSAADQRRGRALGAEDYLVKPVPAATLESAVAAALDRRGGRAQGKPSGPETPQARRQFRMRGRLDQLGLISLFGLLGAGRRSGTLEVKEQLGGGRAKVLLREGRVVSAALDGTGAPVGLEALESVSRWCEGEFSFVAGEVEDPADSSSLLPAV
jgi:CheY-like chemotaxis protein